MTEFLDYQEVQEQAFIHAQKLAEREVKNGYQFEYLFIYTNGHGMPVYWKVRAKNHHTGDKWIRVFSSGERGFKFGDPNFTELYPIGQGKKPLYALEQVLNIPEKQPIYIVEGEQKADFINSLGLTATTCGGSGNTEKTDLKPLAKHSIIIWADNDKAGTKFFNEIAQQLDVLGCDVRYIVLDGLNLPEKGDVMDWADLRKQQGLTTTASDITALITAQYQPPLPSDNLPDGMLAEPMEWENGSFEIHDKGVFYIEKQKNGEYRERFISSPILVTAKTRDNTSNNWGRLLQWQDDAFIHHTWAVPNELFQGDGTESRKALSNQGVIITPDRRGRELFQIYLMSYPVDKFALCVDSVGWHGHRYVLPTETHSNPATKHDELIVYQRTDGLDNRFQFKGELEAWKNGVSLLLESHSKLVFSVACAFAGQLLEPLNQQGGGFHINGTSSKGKSTAIYLACSVWGHPKEYYRTWRSTGNALEQTAFMHNDGFLVLDEIGEASAKDIGQTVYMLANGQGKARMGRTAITKAPQQWRVLFLSSGEKTFKEILNEIGQTAKLGQEIRLPEISLDACEYGVFDLVDFAPDASQQANMLYENSINAYGVAGKAWLEYLTNDKGQMTETALKLYQQYKAKITPDNAQGHIARVASRFAVVAVAGELATQANITGWKKGRALEAVQSVFKTWLNSFEMVGDFEDRQILQQVRAFFEANGNSRFDTLIEGNKRASYGNSDHADDANTDTKSFREKTIYRVGYKVVNAQQRETLRYLFFKEQFKQELCTGFDPKKVAKVLKKHGWLDCANGKTTKQERTPESKNPVWLYVFNTSMFSYDIEKATNPYTDDVNTGTTIDI
ncbi:DUF927 domain-containing protein [Acinetobacter sp. WCHA45]|uniref:DUF927 domain-containing protein n=1 Tax=Acinetobacter sp. WCHA45 TaxID=2004644 RepID=UPI000B3C4F0D|nr:DUF927 domain-containing protein [Acinetobacter sp. WCHA45]AVZ86387.1 DUF927 domain-containing protein [Acinetobacter sp. WCHA45]